MLIMGAAIITPVSKDLNLRFSSDRPVRLVVDSWLAALFSATHCSLWLGLFVNRGPIGGWASSRPLPTGGFQGPVGSCRTFTRLRLYRCLAVFVHDAHAPTCRSAHAMRDRWTHVAHDCRTRFSRHYTTTGQYLFPYTWITGGVAHPEDFSRFIFRKGISVSPRIRKENFSEWPAGA